MVSIHLLAKRSILHRYINAGMVQVISIKTTHNEDVIDVINVFQPKISEFKDHYSVNIWLQGEILEQIVIYQCH